MYTRNTTVANRTGLHARPAGQLVKAASACPCAVRLTANGQTVDMAMAGTMEAKKTDVTITTKGKMPTGQLADAALVLVGGTLLMVPGFFTDIIGLVFLLPFTRPFIRSGISWWASQVLERSGVSPTVIKGSVVVEEDGGEVTLIPAISQSPSDTEGEADGEVLEGTIISSESPETPGA